ncbi:MAG: phage integrase N-terminal SAM-like domain-containing protein, partial [Pseudomonadota bacterium]|nr:phage integrase N-terminal SAM-like domain-containing protein [Pseudomonadota bacterium]
MGRDDIRAYQLHLARDRRLAASSILVAVSAIRFLYKITLKRTWDVGVRGRDRTIESIL